MNLGQFMGDSSWLLFAFETLKSSLLMGKFISISAFHNYYPRTMNYTL